MEGLEITQSETGKMQPDLAQIIISEQLLPVAHELIERGVSVRDVADVIKGDPALRDDDKFLNLVRNYTNLEETNRKTTALNKVLPEGDYASWKGVKELVCSVSEEVYSRIVSECRMLGIKCPRSQSDVLAVINASGDEIPGDMLGLLGACTATARRGEISKDLEQVVEEILRYAGLIENQALGGATEASGRKGEGSVDEINNDSFPSYDAMVLAGAKYNQLDLKIQKALKEKYAGSDVNV
jgi:hypothetical protein